MIPQIEGLQRSIVEDPESFKNDYTIQTLDSTKIKVAETYALTEIDIGYDFIRYTNYPTSKNREEQIKVYWLCLYREDINLIQVPMLPGSVKLEEVKGEKNVLNLTVALSHARFLNEKFDLVVRIRCIKNTVIKGMISKSEEEEYAKFAERIEAYSEGPENAFKNIPFSLQHETRDSALRTKMSDFKTLIDLLCEPETGSPDNVPSGKRYNQRSKCILSDRRYWVRSTEKKPRKETMKNEAKQYRDCKKIELTSVKLADFNLKTLESDNLERLWLDDIDLTENIETLISYTKNINFSKLKDLDLASCKTQPLPDYIAEILPISLEKITLQNCKILSIPESISRLVNLEELHVEENEGLKENGIPWNCLPENITSLSFEDNSIKEIPEAIRRFKNLKILNIVSENLQHVAWKDISNTLEWLKIDSKIELNPIDLIGKNAIEYLSISSPFLKEIISFPSTTRLYLDFCRLKTFNCQNSLQTLVELSIVENDLENMAWEHLPLTLENLHINKNKLQKIENIGHLVNLQELHADDNEIKFLSAEINQLQNLRLLYLSNNNLSELPEGFENLRNLFDLRLADNEFNYDENEPEDLNNKLWKRLPISLGQLVLNSNNLFKLPCCFKFTKLQNLHIADCKLHHICPRLYLHVRYAKQRSKSYCLSLDIRNNKNLKYLSFVPGIIYQPPLATEEKLRHDVIDTFWLTAMEIATDNEKLRNTSKFAMNNFKPVYDFTISDMQISCDCCSRCGKATKDENLRKQNLVMDFMIAITDITDENPFDKPKYEPGKWKSEIHTKMCPKCLEAFIVKTDEAYEKCLQRNTENETVEKRQKLPNENSPFVLGLLNPPIQELQCLKLKNYDSADSFLIAAINVIDSMEELKNSICKFSIPERNTQQEIVKILKQKVKSIRSLRETLPVFAKNEAEDMASALCKLIVSLDEDSRSLVSYSCDTIETCTCGPPIFQHALDCIILHITVGQDSNQSITLNSMVENWTRSNSICSFCNSQKFTQNNFYVGSSQQYLIIKLDTVVSYPEGSNLQCTIPLSNFNTDSQLIFGALWELISAVQCTRNGTTEHYVTWKKVKNGWIVIDKDTAKFEKELLPDLKHYQILIFKKLVVQILNNVGENIIHNCSEVIQVQNHDIYMPSQGYHENNASSTIYSSPQNMLPPINSFINQPNQYYQEQNIPQQYHFPSEYQQPLQQSETYASNSFLNTSKFNNYTSHPINPSYPSASNPQYINPPNSYYSNPLYQAPQQNPQSFPEPMSPISAFVNMNFNDHGNFTSSNDAIFTNINNTNFQQQSEPEAMYYPEEDDWFLKL